MNTLIIDCITANINAHDLMPHGKWKYKDHF